MDDEEETYRLWKIRKTIMQVTFVSFYLPASLAWWMAKVAGECCWKQGARSVQIRVVWRLTRVV